MSCSKGLKRLKSFLCSFATWINLCQNIYAQTSPGFTYGNVPIGAQWNGYFSNKVDWPGVYQRSNTWTGINTFNNVVNFGFTNNVTGSAALNGSTSGTITLKAQPNAGTYNWIMPTANGAQGTVLQSSGTGGLVWAQVPYSQIAGFAQNVNLNGVGDTTIGLSLPTTNYIMEAVWITNTGTLSNLTAGSFSLCTLSGAGGTCIYPTNTQISSITSSAINTRGNGFISTVDDKDYWNVSTWFFRVTAGAGNGALGNVFISVHPLPVGLP